MSSFFSRSNALASLSIAMLFLGCTPSEEVKDGFIINGTIRGTSDGYAFLKKYDTSGLSSVDSIEIKSDGSFSFRGKVSSPETYSIQINDQKHYINLFLENSEISIDGHIDSLSTAEVKGSACQFELDSFYTRIEPFKKKLRHLYKAYYKAERNDDDQMMAEIDLKFEGVMKEQVTLIKNYAFENPNSVVASYVVSKHLSNELSYETLDSIYRNFHEELQGTAYLEKLKHRLEILENVAIGKQAVNIIQRDTAHNNVSLESFKGKLVLLEFWASWCNVCKEENPKIVKIYEEFKPKGFEVIGISLDDDREKWIEAIHKGNLSWVNISDLKGWQNDARKLYGVIETPHNVLIHRDGTIIAKDLYGEDLKEKIRELI